MIEARKLPGVNLKPVVKVQCGTVVKGTSVQKGTNNPIFDEVQYVPRESWGGYVVRVDQCDAIALNAYS